MVAVEKPAEQIRDKGATATVLYAIRTAPRPTSRDVQTLASWYGASALQRAKAHEAMPDAAETLDREAKWLHQYAHARGFCEGVDAALRYLLGEEAMTTFRDTYLKPEWRAAAGLPEKKP